MMVLAGKVDSCAFGDPAMLASIHGQCFATAWSAEAFADLLSLPGTVCLIGTVDNAPGGFVLARQAADEAEILTICVSPTHRRTGIGTKLLNDLIAALQDARSLFIEVDVCNKAGLSFYQRHGFGQIGTRNAYYLHPDGTKSDAMVLRRPLA